MPRRKRIRLHRSLYRLPGQVYAITICTLDHRSVFRDVVLGHQCIHALDNLADRFNMKVYAYCLMPDHVHLLLESSKGNDIARFVGAWKSTCYSIRRSRGRKQRLWQRSFHDHVLRNNEGVRSVAVYIIGNPVRAGMVEQSSDYPLCGSFEFEL